MSIEPMTIIETMGHKRVFGPMFKRRWWGGDSWRAWKAFLRALFALPADEDAMAIYKACTQREKWPSRTAREAWLVVGRRGGKSRTAGLLAVFLACFKRYEDLLAPGEWATIMCISADRKQARVTLEYIRGFIMGVSMLKEMVVGETADSIELTGRVRIEIATASFKATRGYTLAGVVADEVAYWRSEDSAQPDVEIIRALRPGLATLGGMLIAISSPYRRAGELWRMYEKHYGKDGDVLVWQAPSKTMNSTIPQSVIDEAMEADPASARSEFGAEFRSDVAGFVDVEVLKSCVVEGRHELPVAGKSYEGFVDAAGGSGGDSMTMAIAHAEGEKAILDLIREVRPPFSPEAVTAEFAGTLKSYRVFTAAADRYAGDWPREQFEKHGVRLVPSDKTKSEIYLAALPLINSHQVELLDHPRLLRQIETLERRVHSGGKDVIDHVSQGHDDLANAALGALTLVSAGGGTLGLIEYMRGIESGKYDPDEKMILPVTRPPVVPRSELQACPGCGSSQMVVRLGSGQLHCNRCQREFWADGGGQVVLTAGFKNGRPCVYERRVK